MSIKRMHFFNGEFLNADDLNAEQEYHLTLRRRHNQELHTPGIVTGLDVAVSGGKATVASGMAIDRNGREIVLENPEEVVVTAGVTLSIKYKEEETDEVTEAGVTGKKRVRESHEWVTTTGDQEAVPLARITATGPNFIDNSVRKFAAPAVKGDFSVPRNLGIGTTNPTSGRLQFDNNLGNKVVIYDNGSTDRYGLGLNGGNLSVFVPAGGRFSVRQNGYDGTEVMAVTGTGNVQVQGDTLRVSYRSNEGPRLLLQNPQKTGLGNEWAIYNMTGQYGESLQFWNYGGNGWGSKLTIKDNGDVGIGTTSPSKRLHVAGGNGVVNNVFLGDVGHGQDWAGFSHASVASVTAYGFLHHTSGQYALINKKSGAGFIGFRVDNVDKMTITDSGDIQLNGKHAFRTTDSWLRLNQDLVFSSGVHTPGLFAPMSLNVGGASGWASPGNGNAVITGNIGTHGFPATPKTPGWGGGVHTWDVEAEGTIWARNGSQSGPRDLAENYYSDLTLEPGDVVCLDRKENRIVRSERANDDLIIGVISTAPGFLLGAEHGDDEERHDGKRAYPVALSGCVPCKVTDENGPIHRGDLLTSSSTLGHAMKALPVVVGGVEIYAPGTIIGKALESLHSGTAIIEVFVTLR